MTDNKRYASILRSYPAEFTPEQLSTAADAMDIVVAEAVAPLLEALRTIARNWSPTFERSGMSGNEAASIARAALEPPHAKDAADV